MKSTVPRLAFVVSPNGAGHLTRVFRVVAALAARRQIAVTVVASTRSRTWWQVLAAAHPQVELPAVDWLVCDTGPIWSLVGAEVVESIRRIDLSVAERQLATADLVISDNSGVVLDLRPDAILQGSFLWSEVLSQASFLKGVEVVEQFVARERGLLETHQAAMLCTADLAMPAVHDLSRSFDVGWICPPTAWPPRDRARSEPVIGVSHGLTHVAQEEAIFHVRSLQRAGIGVAASRRLACALPIPERTALVGVMEGADSPAVDVMLCRPGGTTLAESVASGTPVGMFCERESPEMAHNSLRIGELGLGVEVTVESVVDDIGFLLSPEFQNSYRRSSAERRRDGLRRSADWLEGRIDAA